jgi:hypothetical protein
MVMPEDLAVRAALSPTCVSVAVLPSPIGKLAGDVDVNCGWSLLISSRFENGAQKNSEPHTTPWHPKAAKGKQSRIDSIIVYKTRLFRAFELY